MNYVKTVYLCENILRHFNIKKYNFFFILICQLYLWIFDTMLFSKHLYDLIFSK